jgi:hypothetical protein
MDARTCRAWVVGIGLVMWMGGTEAAGAGQGVPPDAAPQATTRVRPLRRDDRRVAALLQDAPLRSPTVAGLLASIERSDVLVSVELREPLPNRSGQLTMVSASHGYRYLLVSLDSRNRGDEWIGWLGHELMHALEVAGAPDVQDAGSMRRFFARIACTGSADAGFETTAAIEAGHTVRAEVWRTASGQREARRQ